MNKKILVFLLSISSLSLSMAIQPASLASTPKEIKALILSHMVPDMTKLCDLEKASQAILSFSLINKDFKATAEKYKAQQFKNTNLQQVLAEKRANILKQLLNQILSHVKPEKNIFPELITTALSNAMSHGYGAAIGSSTHKPIPLLIYLIHFYPKNEEEFTQLPSFYELMETLLEHGFNPNVCDEHGVTALMHAVSKGLENLTELLLVYGANPNAQDHGGNTVKKYINQDDYFIKQILENEDELSILYSENELHRAIRHGDYHHARWALNKGNDINDQDLNGRTALMKAVRKYKTYQDKGMPTPAVGFYSITIDKIIQTLLMRKARTDIGDFYHKTVFDYIDELHPEWQKHIFHIYNLINKSKRRKIEQNT